MIKPKPALRMLAAEPINRGDLTRGMQALGYCPRRASNAISGYIAKGRLVEDGENLVWRSKRASNGVQVMSHRVSRHKDIEGSTDAISSVLEDGVKFTVSDRHGSATYVVQAIVTSVKRA